ncbi:hypothetical protein NBRC116589_27560 [Ruegeria sp. HU-ET01832]
MNTKLHAICDSQGRPLNLFVTAGQVSDYIGARALLSSLPDVDWLLVDRGYDADWFREALKNKGIRPCIPGRKQRKTTVKYYKRRYKRRNRIEIMFGRLKDWLRVATRYDRCPKVFLSAIALAALVIYWQGVLTLGRLWRFLFTCHLGNVVSTLISNTSKDTYKRDLFLLEADCSS